MKKILFVAMALLLASCGANNTSTETTTTEEKQATETQQKTPELAIEKGSIADIYYELRDTDAKGEVLDANMDENGNPKGSAFSTSVGEGRLIPGFDKALIGMRAGETKTITVPPEEGYQPETSTMDNIPFEQIAPVATITEKKDTITGISRDTFKISDFNAELLEGKNPGDIIMERDNTTVKLISKTETDVTLEIVNANSPFYNKELKVGTTGEINGVNFTIKSINEEANTVTLDVVNSNSPFYNVEKNHAFEVGSTAEIEQNEGKIQIKILKIDTDENGAKVVSIEQTRIPKLAGKTLYFTIKIDKVTNPTPTTTETSTAQ